MPDGQHPNQPNELPDHNGLGPHPASEKKAEEIAGQLDIGIPKTKLPLAVKIIGLFMILGGLSVAGTFLTDVILNRYQLVFSIVRLGLGGILAVIGYGLIRRRLLALVGFGVVAIVVGVFNPISFVLTAPIFAYLFTARQYLRPGIILGRFFVHDERKEKAPTG